MVSIRDKVEKLPGEYSRGRTIERIHCHDIRATTSAKLDKYLNKDNSNTEPSTSPSIVPPTISNKCQYCPQYKQQPAHLEVNSQSAKVYMISLLLNNVKQFSEHVVFYR